MLASSDGPPAWFNARELSSLVPGQAPGLWWRSADPSGLGVKVWRAWRKAHGIEVIVDLRTPHELTITRLTDEPGVAWHSLPLLVEVPEDWSHPKDRTPEATAERYVAMALRGQTSLRALATLARSGRPLLFHCAAGRDRTGIAAAALLASRGVDDATIAKDYSLSDGVPLDGAAAPSHTMRLFLDLFRRQLGSWEAFLSP